MGLLDQANKDIKQILENKNDFGGDITFTTPDEKTSVTIIGLRTKHNLGVNTDGDIVQAKKMHISFSEQSLINAGYVPVRNAKGEVDLVNHIITTADSTGVQKRYVMQNILPDETIGMISCTLEDFE